jgi:signal transduction histidine kinase
MKRLRGLSAQLILYTILPLFLVLAFVALGSVTVHQNSMREMVGERDLRAVHVVAAALADPNLAQDNQRVRDLLDELRINPQTTVMLIDANGRAIYHTDAQWIGQPISHSGVAEALAGRSGTLYHAGGPGGEEYVVAYAPVSPWGWALVIEEPWSAVASPWLRTSLIAPLLLVPAIALALVAIGLGVQRVIRPLQKLDRQVTALGWGDFDAVSTSAGGIEEIQELQKALARMAAQVRAYQQSMRGYLGAVTAAQEDERKRLARELHDDTVQSLIALKQRVQVMRRKSPGDPSALDMQLDELQGIIETTMDEVRRFSRALRPIYLEEAGLVTALETLARDTSRKDFSVAFEAQGQVRRLTPETELTMYRIVQEALNNAVRHARASSARVSAGFTDGDVTLCVKDDGIGFAVPERVGDLVAAGHYGLMGMQERAQLIGATLTIRSQSGEGTTVKVRLAGRPAQGPAHF